MKSTQKTPAIIAKAIEQDISSKGRYTTTISCYYSDHELSLSELAAPSNLNTAIGPAYGAGTELGFF